MLARAGAPGVRTVFQHRAAALGGVLGANAIRNDGTEYATLCNTKSKQGNCLLVISDLLGFVEAGLGAVFRHLSAWMPCFGRVR